MFHHIHDIKNNNNNNTHKKLLKSVVRSQHLYYHVYNVDDSYLL